MKIAATLWQWGLLTLICFFFFNAQAQNFSIEPISFLPELVKETSGLILLNNKLVTINDSGNEAILYEIDPSDGQLLAEVEVGQAINGDWEGLAKDQEFIYVADIGNNDGDRQDLRIYRIPLSEYLQGNSTVSADSVLFSYQDQTSFVSTPLSNFDAEALISYGDSLYIFTKNWADQHTNIYSLPKTTGSFVAKRVGRINTEGLVTGAVYNPNTDEIMLIGYSFQSAFMVRLWNFEAGNFDQGEITRYPLNLQGSFQVEAIEIVDETDYYITSESNDLGEARLWRINTDFVVGVDDFQGEKPMIYPNPVRHQLHFRGLKTGITEITLYDTMGIKIKSWRPDYPESTQGVAVNLVGIPQGIYQVSITTAAEEIRRKIIIAQ